MGYYNIDFILILLGLRTIWIDIQLEYGGILKTNIIDTFKCLQPRNNYSLYVFTFYLLMPLLGTIITILVINSVMNLLQEYSLKKGYKSNKKISKYKLKSDKEYDNYLRDLKSVSNISALLPKILSKLNILSSSQRYETGNISKKDGKIIIFYPSDTNYLPQEIDDNLESYKNGINALVNGLNYRLERNAKYVEDIKKECDELSKKSLEISEDFIIKSLLSNYSFFRKLKLLFFNK